MKTFYRISDKSYTKFKLPGTNKKVCLINFLMHFLSNETTIVADNVNASTLQMIKDVGYRNIIETNLSNAGSFRWCLDEAVKLADDEIVYFVEDDYLHHKHPRSAIVEGLSQSDYVTLYDHPDKYESEYDGGEVSKVFKTKSTHWRYTASTCMTFATTVAQLKKDVEIWLKYTSGTHPYDHQIFQEIKTTGGLLAVCIPGLAYHTDLTYPMQKYGLEIDSLIEPWAISIAEKEFYPQATSFTGLKKLMFLDSQIKKPAF